LSWVHRLATDKTGTRFPLVWRLLGALLLGVLLARWSWILFAPHSSASAAVAERGVATEAVHLFGVTVNAPAPTETVVLPNVQLAGVFAANAGKSSFAVLMVDGKQVGVALGENAAPGLKLSEVHADYVLLERAGTKSRVNLDVKAVVNAAKPLRTNDE
jgi:general secretion pathway protein C